MAVLLQYNEVDSLTVQQLQENTGKGCNNDLSALRQQYYKLFSSSGINQDSLIQVLQILLKAKLLKSADDENSLTTASTVELFLEYKK